MKAQSEQTISTGYRPRPLQADIHINRKRFSVLAIHRRFGKSVCAISECIDQALTCPLHNPRVAYIAPFYKQAKSIAWDYLKDFTANIPKSKAYESELKVDIPMGEQGTARIQLFGADHPDSLRGLYFDFVVFDEFGLQPISIWEEVVRPALADRKGAAMFLGTPNGKNHFYEMYRKAVQEMNNNNEEWFAATYRADETNVVDAKELESMKENMPDSKYRQEMLCDWSAAVQGAFYADDLNRVRNDGRITNVPYCRSLPVYAAFDLGIDDQTAIWFVQFLRNEIRLIDYVEYSDKGLLDILAEIQQYPYIYGELIMPWDIVNRELTSGVSRKESVEELGFEVIVAPKLTIEDGINAVRALLSQCWFDEQKTALGMDCLENYRKKFDHRTNTFLMRPEHDRFSHGSDAFRYLCVAYDPSMGEFMSRSGRRGYSNGRSKVIRSTL